MKFKYSIASPTQNEFDSLPRLPLSLHKEEQIVEAVGLVDSGATVNVLQKLQAKPTCFNRGM
jgi:hypothetical protein